MKILLVEADVFHSDGQTEVGTDRFFAVLQECVKPCTVFFLKKLIIIVSFKNECVCPVRLHGQCSVPLSFNTAYISLASRFMFLHYIWQVSSLPSLRYVYTKLVSGVHLYYQSDVV